MPEIIPTGKAVEIIPDSESNIRHRYRVGDNDVYVWTDRHNIEAGELLRAGSSGHVAVANGQTLYAQATGGSSTLTLNHSLVDVAVDPPDDITGVVDISDDETRDLGQINGTVLPGPYDIHSMHLSLSSDTILAIGGLRGSFTITASPDNSSYMTVTGGGTTVDGFRLYPGYSIPIVFPNSDITLSPDSDGDSIEFLAHGEPGEPIQ